MAPITGELRKMRSVSRRRRRGNAAHDGGLAHRTGLRREVEGPRTGRQVGTGAKASPAPATMTARTASSASASNTAINSSRMRLV
jgi:hypothetical protein